MLIGYMSHGWVPIPQWYRPMLELMMLSGMIHSEISGLNAQSFHNSI
jgi:hypothetical protein